jgi:hypothetical protein
MSAPKPGPEHQNAGPRRPAVWEATVESWMEPASPPPCRKGVETNTMMGGMWLLTEFKGDFMGAPFRATASRATIR